jgi:hypothetical protein
MAYSTISKPSLYFNTKLYNGTGSTQSITGVGFQPDWIWVKERTSTSSHQLIDAVRGYNKRIISNTTSAEAVDSSPYNDFKSIDSDGFTIGPAGGVNENSQTYASWNWKANGAASNNNNNDGQQYSTVSANTTAGFSIVSYTGTGSNTNYGHGLGVAPKMIIIKNRSISENWATYHASLGNANNVLLNSTNASVSTSDYNSTSPTSSVFYVGSGSGTNGNGNNMIAYCFAEKKGFSKFGKYIGNGNNNGPFIFTGFKPAWIMIKRTDGVDTWRMYDNKRIGFNVDNNPLFANSNLVESTDDDIDFLSNGFKIRRNSGSVNTNGANNIYMSFAEEPLVANVGQSIPATAR